MRLDEPVLIVAKDVAAAKAAWIPPSPRSLVISDSGIPLPPKSPQDLILPPLPLLNRARVDV